MSEWKTIKLEDVDLQFIDGDRGKNYPKGGEMHPSGYCLFLNTGNVTADGFVFKENSFISQEKDEILRKGKLRRNDIVLTTRGTVGNVAYYSNDIPFEHVRINSGMVIVRCGETLNPQFIYYVFRSLSFQMQIKQSQSGSAQPQLPISTLNKLLISLPPLATQKKIVYILSSLDAQIENNNRINRNLEEQAQALFKSWFVDFEPWGGKMPEDWKDGKAEDFFEINIGKTPPRKEKQWFSDCPTDNTWVSISDLGSCGTFIDDSSEYLTAEAIKKHNIILVPKNTVLLSFKLTIGRVAIANKELTTNEAIARFILPDLKCREYLYLYLKQYDFNSLGSTSSIATAVNSKIIKAMKIVMPNPSTIDDFNKKTAPLFEQILVNQQQSARLAALRDTLLPKLMKGEIEL